MAIKQVKKQAKISAIEITNEKLSGRGGIFLFLRFIENTGFCALFEKYFGFIKGSKKGLSCRQFLLQLLAYFIDATDLSMCGFDRRKRDSGYAGLLENKPAQMASSHQMKRFFEKLGPLGNRLYRLVLLQLFIWRLKIEQPAVIKLFVDSVVWDNDHADKRQGVEPTYKKVKGFQPLEISYGPYAVDAIFRSGSVHGNHGQDIIRALSRLTRAIRKYYRDVPIIVLSDSAFMDEKNFAYFEDQLHIFYICSGKAYDDLKQYIKHIPEHAFRKAEKKNQTWHYVEFGNRLKSWSKFRRCIYTSMQTDENGQLLLEFARPDQFIYTNIGMDVEAERQLVDSGQSGYLQAEQIIYADHHRGKCELNHRSRKQFAGKESFPFEKIGMNRAYYYFMLMAHLLYEAYKRDVTFDLSPVESYPATFRRHLIDFAVKIVSNAGRLILKVSQTVYEQLKLDVLWERTENPPLLLQT